MYGAPIVSRCVNAATRALGTLQSGEIAMHRREDYLIQSEALADEDSWRGTVCEAEGAGVEQNADHVLGLTLDTLRAEAFIDRARTAPYPKLPSGPRCSNGG